MEVALRSSKIEHLSLELGLQIQIWGGVGVEDLVFAS